MNKKMKSRLSIYRDSYAFYSEKNRKIYFKGNDIETSFVSIPEDQKMTYLCVQEDSMSFILNDNLLLEGKFENDPEVGKIGFQSVDTLPERKHLLFYVARPQMKRTFLVTGDIENSDLQMLIHDGKEWFDITVDEHNTVERLPEELDFNTTHYVFTKKHNQQYYGAYDGKTMYWKKVDLHVKELAGLALTKNNLFFTKSFVNDETNEKTMRLYKADTKKLLDGVPDATEILFENKIFGCIHAHNESLIIQTFSQYVFIIYRDRFVGLKIEIDEDDFFIGMNGNCEYMLFQTFKERVFKMVLNEEGNNFSVCKEIIFE